MLTRGAASAAAAGAPLDMGDLVAPQHMGTHTHAHTHTRAPPLNEKLKLAALAASTMAGAAADPSAITAALTPEELGQTVEEYLQAQCDKRVKNLKRHMEDKIAEFEEGVKRGRRALVEAANPAVEDTVEEVATDGPLCDPFALVAVKGPRAGTIFKLEPTESQKLWKIGRDKAADISLAGDDEVSSSHAQIAFEKKQFKLMDLDSTNGTIATTGQSFKPTKLRANRNHVLKVNHLVTFGGSTFRWCDFSDAEDVAKQAPALQM